MLWYPDNLEARQWLVYFISRPLIGSPELIDIAPAMLPSQHGVASLQTSSTRLPSSSESAPSRKDVQSFNDILNAFPMIARQMQPDLERLFREFGRAFEKPLPSRPLQQENHVSSHSGEISSNAVLDKPNLKSSLPNGHIKPLPEPTEEDNQEAKIRQAVEHIVTAAIDLFQLVDKQQLSALGATTTLTGPLVERMIERYVIEQVHDSTLFPAVCAIKRFEDQELESRIRQMESLDISQVGIPISGGMQGKHDLLLRLEKGVGEFRRLGVAGSPQEMMDILLATEKTVATVYTDAVDESRQEKAVGIADYSEKPNPVLTVNADTLVSLLLVVVIRSQVRHLQARLTYMRDFIFIDDVEGGEMGYALSTFEAVLSYLAKNSGGLRRSSRQNKLLWEAIYNGRIEEIRTILDPENVIEDEEQPDSKPEAVEDSNWTMQNGRLALNAPTLLDDIHSTDDVAGVTQMPIAPASDLDSIVSVNDVDRAPPVAPRSKRVSMDMRSISSSSGQSLRSRATTIDSREYGVEGDISIERLSKTQDPTGESVVMMAIEHRQPEALRYLLSLSKYFPLSTILGDSDNVGTTLLSAAVQLGHTELIDIILDFVLQANDEGIIKAYFARQDNRGRTMAHYLFNAHSLIERLSGLLPWRVKDKNGQTPLFALCRSYDHQSYRQMVGSALGAAKEAQRDGLPLHLDDHIDAKGNTLLHVVNDPQLVRHMLLDCSTDVNATNDKRFTPFMVASKYGRVDLVSIFLGDPRVDVYVKDLRGLTAVELAKDDEVRNRIDDLLLLSIPPDKEGRMVAIVRSYFVEDATIRLVVKSAVPSSKSTITITTSRRSLSDFENLAKWLSIEHPVSWLPSIAGFRSPFQIPSKPSRAVLRDIQLRLDSFLRILLAHPTFSAHEMVWEFFLMPESLPEMTSERSRRKAAAQAERIKDEYAPVEDVREVELFVQHAKNEIRGVNQATRSVVRRIKKLRTVESDISDASRLSSRVLSTLSFLEQDHIKAFNRFTETLTQSDAAPYTVFHQDLQSISSTITAMLDALSRPHVIIESMRQASKAIDRHLASLRRSDRWPLGLLDDTRNKIHHEAADKVEQTTNELTTLASQLRYTQQTVASELAAWQDLHQRMAQRAVKSLAERMVIVEKARLEGMKRAIRGVVDVPISPLRGRNTPLPTD